MQRLKEKQTFAIPNLSILAMLHPSMYIFGPHPLVPSLSQQNLHHYDALQPVQVKSKLKLGHYIYYKHENSTNYLCEYVPDPQKHT